MAPSLMASSQIWKLNEEILLLSKNEDQLYVLLDVERGQLSELNAAGSIILELCDGVNSISQIVDHLKTVPGVPGDTVEKDVYEFLTALIERGWLTISGVGLAHSIERDQSKREFEEYEKPRISDYDMSVGFFSKFLPDE